MILCCNCTFTLNTLFSSKECVHQGDVEFDPFVLFDHKTFGAKFLDQRVTETLEL